MGRGRSKAGAKAVAAAAITAAAMAAVATHNVPLANPVANATAMTDAEAAALRLAEESAYDPTTMAAIKMYISNTDFDNQGHSLSQTMNFLLDEAGGDMSKVTADGVNFRYGLNLSANDMASIKYTNAKMAAAAHALGKDTLLQRGAHDDILRNTFGIADYSKMTQAQLQKALVGKAFKNDSYMSCSYDINKNPFLGKGSGVSGGREVVFNVKAGKNTKVLLGAKSQSEIILNKNTNFKITGVRYTGVTATPRGRGAMPQIEIDIETF